MASIREGQATTWREVLARGAVSGSMASLASTVALALRGHSENGSPAAPTNAISHWIWGDRAFRQDLPSVRHTITGYLIHHAASVFWAVIFEKMRSAAAASAGSPPKSSGYVAIVRDAAATSALACFVDFQCTPRRLTPGFEQRLSRRSLVGVYAAFALGLAAGALIDHE